MGSLGKKGLPGTDSDRCDPDGNRHPPLGTPSIRPPTPQNLPGALVAAAHDK